MPYRLPKIVVTMIGARRQYAVPRIFAMAGWLEHFFTDYFLGAGLFASLVRLPIWPAPVRALAGRSAPELPPHLVSHYPLFALRRLRASKLASTEPKRWRAFVEWNRAFAKSVARQDWGAANGVYVFNAAGLEILQRATQENLVRIMDQTSLPWDIEQNLIQEERERWPGWEEAAVSPSDWAPLAERERAEWELADMILCGSESVRRALGALGVPSQRCQVVPYGIAPDNIPAKTRTEHGGPLRVLFVGTVELRKGIPYLYQAAEQLPASVAVFRAVGRIRLSSKAAARLTPRIELFGPLPRTDLSEEYAWADVVVLPTLSEGSANVCYEALAHGVPVITTEAAGSVIRDGIEGFIVPPRDAVELVERLSRLAQNRSLLRSMSEAALQRAQDFSLDRYAARLTTAVRAAYESAAEATKP